MNTMQLITPCLRVPSRLFLTIGLVSSLSLAGTLPQAARAADEPAATEADEQDRWVTSLALLEGDSPSLVMATASGLLLRESTVLTATPQAPNRTEVAFAHPVASWAVAASPDGSRVFASDYRGNLTVYNVAEQKPQRHDEVFERWTRTLACSPDGKQLLAANEAGKLFVWDVAAGKVGNSVELDASAVMDLAFSPDGKTVAVADGAGHVHFLNWPKLDAMGEVQVSEEAVWSVCFTADGKKLLAGAADNHVYQMPVQPEAKATSIAKASDWVTAVTRNRQGVIAAAELGGRIHLLSGDGSALGTPLEAPSGVWALCWTDAGSLLVGTRKDGVQVVEQKWGWGDPDAAPVEEAADKEAADKEAAEKAAADKEAADKEAVEKAAADEKTDAE